MNIYTLTYDANLPTKQQVNIPTNTDYKVGIKMRKNGEMVELDTSGVTLETLSADTVKTNGYVTFTESAGDEPICVEKTLDIDAYEVTHWDSGPMYVA